MTWRRKERRTAEGGVHPSTKKKKGNHELSPCLLALQRPCRLGPLSRQRTKRKGMKNWEKLLGKGEKKRLGLSLAGVAEASHAAGLSALDVRQ